MATTNPSRDPSAPTKFVLSSPARRLVRAVGAVLLTAVAVYLFAQIAAIALVIVGLSLGGGSFG
jgi:hypothetical protein